MFTRALAWARSWRVPPAGRLAGMSDDELTAYAWSARREAGVTAALAELDRRDREAEARSRAAEKSARAAAKRAALREEHCLYVRAAWLAAEAECNGYLLSRAGKAAGIDPAALWSMPRQRAERLASEELRDWWSRNGRVTFGEWQRRSRQRRPEPVPA
jgi:hypothetical protein